MLRASTPLRSPAPAALDAALVMGAAAPVVLLLAWAAAGVGAGLAAAAIGWAAAMAAVARGVALGHPHVRFGTANLVTTARAGAVAVLAAVAVEGGAPSWPLVAAAGAALALDGVDGLAARTVGRASDFGARYDMEVDSVLALVLAVLVWSAGPHGAWILILGLPRYAFGLAARLVPALGAPLPPSRARKAVAVQQMGTLVVLLIPGLPAGLGAGLALASLGTLGWSFGRDVARLGR